VSVVAHRPEHTPGLPVLARVRAAAPIDARDLRLYAPRVCLGIPGRIVELDRERELLMGKVAFGGIQKEVCLEYVPEAQPGDWVLVHVGFALSRIDEAEAARTFELLRELEGLDEADEGAG
jgi:hydrogenase expression/formation protein HypC